MRKVKQSHIDLNEIASKSLTAAGFSLTYPPLSEDLQKHQALPIDPEAKDLTGLLWSSIDNVESQDLDQIEYAEELKDGTYRVMVGIADVDQYVPKGSPLDLRAEQNTTSVYTGSKVFPMLPECLSCSLTSLLPDGDRQAIIFDLTLDANGAVNSTSVYKARVANKAKLNYEDIGNWLENGALQSEINKIPGLEAQLRLQDKIAQTISKLRQSHGSLQLETGEAVPIVQNNVVLDIMPVHHNRATALIENFMVAANGAIARYLDNKGWPSIRRVVKEPEQWPRIVSLTTKLGYNLPHEPDAIALAKCLIDQKQKDPEHYQDLSLSIVKLLGPGEYEVEQPGQAHTGHFGLAVHDYTHSTAPNRRYSDLVEQRMLKAAISGSPCPYSYEELEAIALKCTQKESASRKIERLMRKVAAAVLLAHHIGQVYDAIVTGASPKGTYVRLLHPPAEGRVMHGTEGLEVGEKIKVRLVSTNAVQGFVDFEPAG